VRLYPVPNRDRSACERCAAKGKNKNFKLLPLCAPSGRSTKSGGGEKKKKGVSNHPRKKGNASIRRGARLCESEKRRGKRKRGLYQTDARGEEDHTFHCPPFRKRGGEREKIAFIWVGCRRGEGGEKVSTARPSFALPPDELRIRWGKDEKQC